MIAFEFDESTLRVAMGEASDRQFRVTDLFSIDLQPTDQETGVALGQALRERGVTKSDAIGVINRWQVEIRELTVPPAPDNELPSLVRFQARNEFVSLGDDWPLDFLPLDQGSDDGPQRIFAAAVAPTMMARLKTIADIAGVKLKHVVLRPLSLLDLLADQFGSDDHAGRLVIYPTDDRADLSVAKGNRLTATRSIRFPADATPEKRSSLLISETRRTLASAKSLAKLQVEHVLIIGDPKRFKTVTGNLEGRLNLDVQFVDPIELIQKSDRLAIPANAAEFAGLLGSLVHDASDRPHAMDFLAPRRPIVLKPDRTRWYAYGGFALAASLFFILLGWWTLRSQQTQIDSLTTKLSKVTANNEGNANRPNVDQIVSEVGAIDQWKLNDVNWLTELKAISDRLLLPDDVIIDTLTANVGRTEPVIDVQSRVASVQKETELQQSLGERPYQFSSKRSVEDGDDEYPLSLDFQANFTPELNALVQRMNQQAAALIQAKNATPAEPPDPAQSQ